MCIRDSFQAFHHDLYRSVGQGRWWVMEQQPGPVNWAPWNPAPLPGMVRLWAIEAAAHGAEVISYFRWRQAPFAQEQLHAGLLYPDDTPAPGLSEAASAGDVLKALPKQLEPASTVALIFDYTSDWMWKVLPQGQDFDYFRLVFSAYRALRRAGYSVDILSPESHDFTGYTTILAPGLGVIPQDLADALAECDARAIVGPRSNLSTEHHATRLPMGPALPGLDVTVTHVESLPPEVSIPVQPTGHIRHWREHIRGSAKIRTQASDGSPVLIGNDTLAYLTAWPDDALWDHLLGTTDPLPDGLRIRDTHSHRFLINYSAHAQTWNGQTVPACDALILEHEHCPK